MDYTLIGTSTVVIMVDGCHVNPSVTELQQTPTEVRVTVHRDPVEAWLGRSTCADSVTIELDAPLADRPILRAASRVAVPAVRG